LVAFPPWGTVFGEQIAKPARVVGFCFLSRNTLYTKYLSKEDCHANTPALAGAPGKSKGATRNDINFVVVR